MSDAETRTQLQSIIDKHAGDPTELLAILKDAQALWRLVTPEMVTLLAEILDLPRVHVEGTATFYHFLSGTHAGTYTVYVNTSMTAEMAGLAGVVKAFEDELGIAFGDNTSDNLIGLRKTSCIGMSDQEPALLINGTVFTRVTPDRVRELVAGMRARRPVHELVTPSNDSNNALPSIHAEVTNNIQLKGPVFFTEYDLGSGLKKAMTYDSLDVLEVIKASGLRGRGGAGFPTGAKWGFCRAAEGETRYLMCNADEGEPGTFKDRVLLTEMPELIFEGMTIAGFAMEATHGIVYLRGEYGYLREHLEGTLASMRARHLLGRGIQERRFLATNVGARPLLDANVEVKVGPEDDQQQRGDESVCGMGGRPPHQREARDSRGGSQPGRGGASRVRPLPELRDPRGGSDAARIDPLCERRSGPGACGQEFGGGMSLSLEEIDLRPGERVLVYGIGNVGRQDDGLGVRLVEQLEHVGDESDDAARITFETNYQLGLEDALLLSRFDVVLFLDASCEEHLTRPFALRSIAASDQVAFTTHAMSFASVLSICEELYDRRPRTFLLAIRGYEWGISEEMSPAGCINSDAAFASLSVMLKSRRRAHGTELRQNESTGAHA